MTITKLPDLITTIAELEEPDLQRLELYTGSQLCEDAPMLAQWFGSVIAYARGETKDRPEYEFVIWSMRQVTAASAALAKMLLAANEQTTLPIILAVLNLTQTAQYLAEQDETRHHSN